VFYRTYVRVLAQRGDSVESGRRAGCVALVLENCIASFASDVISAASTDSGGDQRGYRAVMTPEW
jgi:hypothetical protein